MNFHTFYRFCPVCGNRNIKFDAPNHFFCKDCGHSQFFNVAAAVGVLIYQDDRILLTKRGRNPGRGMLDFAGGFVDHGEVLEDTINRELREELKLQVNNMEYLTSYPNSYLFERVEYSVMDIFFMANPASRYMEIDNDELQDARWYPVAEVNPDDFAFESHKHAFRVFQEKRS